MESIALLIGVQKRPQKDERKVRMEEAEDQVQNLWLREVAHSCCQL